MIFTREPVPQYIGLVGASFGDDPVDREKFSLQSPSPSQFGEMGERLIPPHC